MGNGLVVRIIEIDVEQQPLQADGSAAVIGLRQRQSGSRRGICLNDFEDISYRAVLAKGPGCRMINIAEGLQIQIRPAIVGIGQIKVVKSVLVRLHKHPLQNSGAFLTKIVIVNFAEQEQIGNALQEEEVVVN